MSSSVNQIDRKMFPTKLMKISTSSKIIASKTIQSLAIPRATFWERVALPGATNSSQNTPNKYLQ